VSTLSCDGLTRKAGEAPSSPAKTHRPAVLGPPLRHLTFIYFSYRLPVTELR